MDVFLTSVKLVEREVLIKEFNFGLYRNLLKCLINENTPNNILFQHYCFLIKKTTNLSKKEIYNLTYIDFLLLLLYIRAYSIGDGLKLIFHSEKTDETTTQPVNIDLSLEATIQYITSILQPLVNLQVTLKNLTVHLQLPTIKSILNIETITPELIVTMFIKQIQINNQVILFANLSEEAINKIIEALPITLFNSIKQNINIHINVLQKLNFFGTLTTKTNFNKELLLLPNIKILFYVLQLAYNNDLQSMYDNIFLLTKAGNFSPSYLDSCSPGEVFVFIKKLEESYSKKHDQSNDKNANIDNGSLDDIFDELPPLNAETPSSQF
jgi:hypothetical protein